MSLLLAVLLCVVCGLSVASFGQPRSPSFSGLLFRASLSVGYGLGIFSVLFFLARVFRISSLLALDITVSAVLLVTALLLAARSAAPEPFAAAQSDLPRLVQRILSAAFIVALGVSVYAAILRALAHPHGDGWDAFAIWNLHARFLSDPGWLAAFSPLIPSSHPDYPLLLPAAVAHFWTSSGHQAPAVPAVLGLAFTFSTAGLLFSALDLLHGRNAATLGALTLITTPFYIEQGTSQYADVPLSFFILATVALLALHDRSRHPALLVSAGFAAGFAAWTKNEGLLFLCSIVAAGILVRFLPQSYRPSETPSNVPHTSLISFFPFLAATIPAVLLIAYFKHLTPPNDLLSTRTAVLHKLIEPSRYWAIIRWYFKGFLLFGHWLVIPGTLLLIAFYFATKSAKARKCSPSLRSSTLALVLALAGYFAVYLITPYDLYWHLRFSLARLFLQLWPSAIFLFFLTIPLGPVASEAHDNVSK